MATYYDDGVLGSIDFSSAVLVDSDDAIARLDRQLALTEEKLENGLEELIVAINSLSVDNDYTNVKDAVDSLIKTSSLEECACLQPEPHDVIAFLQTLALTIDKSSTADNVDCLLDLLQLCCKHGFVLPFQAPPAGDKTCSTISINTISSSSELEIEQLWTSIRLQLKKQLLKKLADPLFFCPDMKLNLLQGLVFLYPADEAWKIYKSHRGQEINQALVDGLHLEDAQPEDVLKNIKDRFRQVQHTLKDMMVTDFKTMSSRVFQDVNIYNALKSLYSSKISQYLVVNVSQPSKMTTDLENMGNSSSTITIKESDILAVSVLASELMEFESAMEDVLHQLNWTSEARSKRTSKQQPKGVLKVSREARMSKLGLSTDSTLPLGTVPPLFSAVATMVATSSSQGTKNLQLEHWWKDILSGFEEQLVTMIPLLVQQSLSNHDTAIRTTPTTGTLVCEQQYGWSSCPRYVSKRYGSFFTLVQQLTPIACVSNTLQDVFVTSVRSAINDILLYVYKVKSAEASSIALDCVQALSMATYCAAVLLQLHQALHEGKENSCFVSLRQQFLEVIDELADKLVSYHVTTLCNILLHDADSHNYTDQRAFYEDERCSFSVQMYHLHLESVKHDWSMWLPGHLMQKMMMSVVERSLSKLAHRYSLVKPSYKRMRQMRVDITALLFIIYNNMLTFCDSVCDVMGQAEFHASCQCLLRVIAVVTSPLDVLCKAFHRSLKHEKHQVFSMIPSWLQCVAPSLFPFDVVEFSNLPDKSAVHIIVSILSRQPCVNLSLTLQALTMRESVLAKILCEQLDELNEQSSCVGLGCSGIKCLCSLMQPEKSILMPIARLLATCNEQPQCLANVLVPIIEKGGGCGNLPGKREEVPPWLLYIKQLFAPQIERLIKSCVKDLVEYQREGRKKKNSMSNLTHLPCGCPLARERKLKLKDEEHVLNSAAQTLLSRLSQVILCFSLPLCLVFQRLQEKVDQEENCKKAVALEVLCWCVWNTLRTQPFDTSDKSALVTLKHASEMTMEVLSMEADETDYSSHPLSSDWLKELIAMTTSHCTQDHLANFNIHPVEEGPLIFQEKYYMGMAIDMATNKQGVKDLILINKLIKRNAEWIEDQLEIPALIPHVGKPSFHSQITLEPMTPLAFNPIEQFNKLGRGGFDHEAFGEYAWDWPEMLKINLGLTPVTFRHLFSNRFEMLEGEPLNDNEKKYVAILKERYELDVELV
ncbi:uncharacterized protein KIAA0825-like isoform X2 [Anneissia japonica]|uniref:uncharacterized protein KIAA0825-like isoform X2 n=1 Tax=Anneissia japonica TaxID=1529436 RepID=UPI0014255978|nr:uncharacterized protein KIAA0825-like isoform X2 [Anneissia japonica]